MWGLGALGLKTCCCSGPYDSGWQIKEEGVSKQMLEFRRRSMSGHWTAPYVLLAQRTGQAASDLQHRHALRAERFELPTF